MLDYTIAKTSNKEPQMASVTLNKSTTPKKRAASPSNSTNQSSMTESNPRLRGRKLQKTATPMPSQTPRPQ